MLIHKTQSQGTHHLSVSYPPRPLYTFKQKNENVLIRETFQLPSTMLILIY